MVELCRITIPQFPIKIEISKQRRAKYYKIVKGKWKPKPLTKTLLSKLMMNELKIKDNFLVDQSGNKIIANPKVVGTPRFQKLSGNDLVSGYGSPLIRAKLVKELKKFYLPFVQNQLTPIDFSAFPLWIDWHLYTTVNPSNFDLSNLWFYYKYFEDCLFMSRDFNGRSIRQIIPDDCVEFITHPGTAPILHPIENFEDRKFEFIFYTDDIDRLNENFNSGLWNK